MKFRVCFTIRSIKLKTCQKGYLKNCRIGNVSSAFFPLASPFLAPSPLPSGIWNCLEWSCEASRQYAVGKKDLRSKYLTQRYPDTPSIEHFMTSGDSFCCGWHIFACEGTFLNDLSPTELSRFWRLDMNTFDEETLLMDPHHLRKDISLHKKD